jgi:hypothetical protein
VHHLRDTVHGEDLFHQFLCQYTGFVGVNVNTDDVSGEDIDHHVRVEVGSFHRSGELGDVPRVHLPRLGRDQFRARLGRVAGEPGRSMTAALPRRTRYIVDTEHR